MDDDELLAAVAVPTPERPFQLEAALRRGIGVDALYEATAIDPWFLDQMAQIVDERTVLLGSYHYARAASRFIRDAHELFAGASRSISGDRLRLTGYTTAGLSKGAAAVSGGVSLSVKF